MWPEIVPGEINTSFWHLNNLPDVLHYKHLRQLECSLSVIREH